MSCVYCIDCYLFFCVVKFVCYFFFGDFGYGVRRSFFFFFKQKTAYDVRISDWSSDVCSSDLRGLSDHQRPEHGRELAQHVVEAEELARLLARDQARVVRTRQRLHATLHQADCRRQQIEVAFGFEPVRTHRHRTVDQQADINHAPCADAISQPAVGNGRSEEHTSELQSLMRISYADFCLNKTT